MDEDKLAQQVEEQKEKDAAQGKQRAVKYRQKRAKVSRDAQMRNSMSVEPEEPEPSREFSAEDYLQPEAFDFGASGGSMPPETHNMFQRYSEPLGNDIDLMFSQGGLPTPRFNPPSSGLYHSSWQHPSGIGAYYNSTSSYTPSRSSPSSYRQPLGGSDQDLLHRIQHGQEMGRDWPPKNTRSASTPLYSSTRWTDEGRQWGGRNEFDAFGLGHLLNDEHAPQSFSALGQAVRANDHRDRSYTLEPEQKVQCKNIRHVCLR